MRCAVPARGEISLTTPLRLHIAAALAFPDGSMTASGLRRESARGRLVVERIAGKDYTTLANIARMRELCRVEAKVPDCTLGGAGGDRHSGSSLTPEVEIGTAAGEDDLGEAEKALADYIARTRHPSFGRGDPAEVLVADVLSEYGEKHAPTTRRPTLIGGAISKLVDFFVDQPVSKVTSSSCADYVRWRTAQRDARVKAGGKPVKASTARRELVVLSAAIRWCWNEGKLDRPVPVPLPAQAGPRERHLNRAELAALLVGALGWDRWGKRHQGAN